MAVDSQGFTLNINQNYIILFICHSNFLYWPVCSSLSETAVIVDVAHSYNEPLLMNTHVGRQTGQTGFLSNCVKFLGLSGL